MTDLDARLAAIAELNDPIERVRAIDDLRKQTTDLLRDKLARATADAITEARATMTLQQIADLLGVSKQRAHQLSQPTTERNTP